jgi:hypothetical protein
VNWRGSTESFIKTLKRAIQRSKKINKKSQGTKKEIRKSRNKLRVNKQIEAIDQKVDLILI